ncbi:MAG: LCP family protein [Lachnospiraceae bacterium]|nr:LCP family protein [Lachnospiraceae bacterium]
MEDGGFWEEKMREEEKKRDAYGDFKNYVRERENAEYLDGEEIEEDRGWDLTDEDGDFDDFCVDTGGIFEEEEEEALFASLNESLMRQVAEELDGMADTTQGAGEEITGGKKMGKTKKVLKVIGSLLLVLVLLTVFLIGTRPGRKIVINFAAKFITVNTKHKEPGAVAVAIHPFFIADGDDKDGFTVVPMPMVTPVPEDAEKIRKEDYVKNILIFGIDQGDMDSVHAGSLNTDTIMIATLNTKDKSVKITSLLRDMYVELDDGVGRKINSIYAIGRRNNQGPELLMHTIEDYFKIDLMGYAYVKLASFEDVVDILGGVTIELGSKEANYLNTTNYITNPRNRNLKSGENHMNGNQVAGYCRIRKVETLGGATNDYGRTLRQRRVLQAIFQKYKSQSFMNLLPVTQSCLSKITTNLTEQQIAELLEMFLENGISEMDSFRLPINDSFYDSGKKGYNGITYGLVIDDIEANILYLYENLYADTPDEAKENYEALNVK